MSLFKLNARASILAAFVFSGTLAGNWLARMPAIKAKHALSESELGVVLMIFAIGVILGLLLVGSLIQRFGSLLIVKVTTLVVGIGVILVGLSPNYWSLVSSLFLIGLVFSSLDVAMNEQAVQLETRDDRALMGSFHAGFSLGTLIGALMGYFMVRIGFGIHLHFAIVSIILTLLTLLSYRHLLVNAISPDNQTPVIMIPPRAIWGLGVIAFGGAIAEGTLSDWTAVYLVNVFQAPESTATLGFVCFALLMVIGRLSGDKLVERFGAQKLVLSGGIAAIFGLAMTVLSPTIGWTFVGVSITALGLANIIPIVFSAGGRQPGVPSSIGIASVSSIGYLGFLAGPPVIGFVAEVTSLRVSFALIILLLLPLLWLSHKVRRRPPESV